MSQYYLSDKGQQVGPLSLEQLKSFPLTPDSPLWCEGMPAWGYVKDRPEVMAALSLQVTERKPELNGMIYANIVIQVVVTLLFMLTLAEDYDMGPTGVLIFGGLFAVSILLYLFACYQLLQRNYRQARILSIIGCVLFVPIGLVGIIGMTKAIDKVTDSY